MIWISLILGILQALPTIIDLIKKIVDLIHGHPMQAFHEHAFMGIIQAWKYHQDPVKLEAELNDLHARLSTP